VASATRAILHRPVLIARKAPLERANGVIGIQWALRVCVSSRRNASRLSAICRDFCGRNLFLESRRINSDRSPCIPCQPLLPRCQPAQLVERSLPRPPRVIFVRAASRSSRRGVLRHRLRRRFPVTACCESWVKEAWARSGSARSWSGDNWSR
jgi:hypothetical protein